MAYFLFVPRVKQTITTTGTGGSFDLSGGVTDPTYMTFDAAGAITVSARNSSFLVYYSMDDGTNFEVGVGTFVQSTQIVTRTAVLASSNANAAVNWGAGNKTFALINYTSGIVATDATGAADLSSYPVSGLGARAVCIGSRGASGVTLSNGAASANGADAISIKGAASGASAIVIGVSNAPGDYSVCIGSGSLAGSVVNSNAVAIGYSTTANNASSVAIGDSAWSSGIGGVAIGKNSASYANAGVALGTYAYAWQSDTVAFGPGLADSGAVGTGGNLLSLYLNKASAIGTSEVMRLPTTSLSPTFESATGYNAFGVISGKVIGHNGTDYKVFDVVVAFHRVSGTVSLLGSATVTAGVASSGASTWTLTVATDGTGIDFTVNAAASKWTGALTMAWSNS